MGIEFSSLVFSRINTLPVKCDIMQYWLWGYSKRWWGLYEQISVRISVLISVRKYENFSKKIWKTFSYFLTEIITQINGKIQINTKNEINTQP